MEAVCLSSAYVEYIGRPCERRECAFRIDGTICHPGNMSRRRKMHLRLILLLSFLMAAVPTMAESLSDRWNLADLYPSIAAWNEDTKELESQMREFERCKGHLGESVARFKKCLDLQADMAKRYARLYHYSSQLLAEDTGAASSIELNQKGEVLGARLNETTAFVNPEVL